MRGTCVRVKVRRLDAHHHPFAGGAGQVVVDLKPRTPEDLALLIELLREAMKNDSWVEIGGGAGSVHAGIRVVERPALAAVLEGEVLAAE